MAKNPKIKARIGQNEYEPHAITDNNDFIHVRQGDEHVRLIIKHPSEQQLVESNPKWNTEETYPNGWASTAVHQHTLWDKPRGSANKPEIDTLFATPGAKNLVGTAIGLAVEHAHKRFGQTPTGSRDLSEKSLPMVERLNKHLKARGIDESPTPWRPSNEVTQDEDTAKETRELGEKAFKNDWYKPVSDREIGSANSLIRGLYKGRNLNKQQFHQPELPL
jgi:hypothetical protein